MTQQEILQTLSTYSVLPYAQGVTHSPCSCVLTGLTGTLEPPFLSVTLSPAIH